MKDFAPHTLFAIAEEAFGAWLYAGLFALAALAALYLWLALAHVRVGPAARRGALSAGVLAAVAAVALAPMLTDARHVHLVATIDWAMLTLAAAGAFAAGFLLALPVLAAATGRPTTRSADEAARLAPRVRDAG